MSRFSLLFQDHSQGAGSQVEQLEIELALIWDAKVSHEGDRDPIFELAPLLLMVALAVNLGQGQS